MNFLSSIRSKLIGVDPEAVAAYQTVLPRQIDVTVRKDGKYFIATIKTIEDTPIKGSLMTEAKDIQTLVNNVNDLIYTKINMPAQIRPYYGNVFKPEGYKNNAKEMLLVKV
ncbi:hypothetical protein IPP75_01930 [Candidatus Saccharibacteria bacterium]|nr:MAG: hypothetical protein IPP75_01930 [Candidatus Saccharibacteria bacterium]